MCPAWFYALSLRRWCSMLVITTWRKAPCQSRRLPRSGIFTVHYAAIRSRCQSPLSPSNHPRRGSATSTTSFASTRWCRRSCKNQPATKYIDIYTAIFKPNQKPNPALFVQDKIHLSGRGYEILRRDVSIFLSNELHPRPQASITKRKPAWTRSASG
jgi:hypothetical protein